jgi:3-methylcrotonyl-CoA carboxylase alpha subunit
LHVKMADEAYLIGPADAAQSYLDGAKILEVAKKAGAESIHPGYGFLSENPGFAEDCSAAMITFVGPPASAMRAMGLKDAAKVRMEEAGVPVVPGYLGEDQSGAVLAKEATKICFPVLIKAVAGGGGKGMRRVDSSKEFADALASCQREAKAAFGEDRVLIEKFVSTPRHIEVQVFADSHGNAIHLFERDCSLQRRHQKVIEEAPAPGMTASLREAMGAAAVTAALAVGYEGAGTVEFIVDASDGLRPDGFYFMEMNTRLQVEHPVTELITGLDLVELQFQVAAGAPLGIGQEELEINGHAIEARLYAEDPANEFLPQAGRVEGLKWPRGNGIRIDTGVELGADISPFYDPMIAKVIAHGADRLEAISALEAALRDLELFGLRSNQAFLIGLLAHRAFRDGDVETGFIAEHMGEVLPEIVLENARVLAGLAAINWLGRAASGDTGSPWNAAIGWSMAGLQRRERLNLLIDGKEVLVCVSWHGDGSDGAHFILQAGGDMIEHDVTEIQAGSNGVSAVIDGTAASADILQAADNKRLFVLSNARVMIEIAAQDLLAREEGGGAGASIIRAPMSGRIIKLNVKTGDLVKQGATIAILEAMKMEHALTAGMDAPVGQVLAEEGAQVEEGQILVTLDVDD